MRYTGNSARVVTDRQPIDYTSGLIVALFFGASPIAAIIVDWLCKFRW